MSRPRTPTHTHKRPLARAPACPPRAASQGLALIAVLWLVAAMGLIITGVVKSVKTETRSSGQQRQSLQAQSQADAVLLLALQNLYFQDNPLSKATQSASFVFAGQAIQVELNALNGLIDINNAPGPLLAQLYAVAGGLPNDAAQALAQATVQTRETPSVKGLQAKFDAPEDLLQVPGFTYDLYAKMRDLVTADLKDGSGRVNPMAAPVSVLQVLTGGDAGRAAALYANRNVPLTGMDTTVLNPAFIDSSISSSLRLQALVPTGNGASLVRTWDVLSVQDRRTGLPWRVLGKSLTLSTPASN
jgi:general secretion pathway protein K